MYRILLNIHKKNVDAFNLSFDIMKKKMSLQCWGVVEKYMSGQKGYEKVDTVAVVVVDAENENLERTRPGT